MALNPIFSNIYVFIQSPNVVFYVSTEISNTCSMVCTLSCTYDVECHYFYLLCMLKDSIKIDLYNN